MTKPADSDQIAKARERADEWVKENYMKLPGSGGQVILAAMVAFAASERQAVIEDCCRAVCELCARGVELEQLKLTDSDTLYWHHKSKEWQENGDCAATAIRSME